MNIYFIFGLIYVTVLWIFIDVFQFYKYLWCKKKCSGKKCHNWACKGYNECCSWRKQRSVLNTLHEIGFELVIGDDKTAQVPDYIPKESFPVEFVFTKYKLQIDSMEALENLSKCNYTVLVDKNYQTKD